MFKRRFLRLRSSCFVYFGNASMGSPIAIEGDDAEARGVEVDPTTIRALGASLYAWTGELDALVSRL